MKHLVCDLTGADLTEGECSTLRIAGPLAHMTNRREIHLGKAPAAALAKWLGLLDAGHPLLEGADDLIDRERRRAAEVRTVVLGPTTVAEAR